MQKKNDIFNLSEFRLERKAVSTGGMSGKVYRGLRDGKIYYIKSGSLSEVFAEVIFNRLAKYCGLAYNSVFAVRNDTETNTIDSEFVVGERGSQRQGMVLL